MNASAPRRPPLSDSPWFWVYLFATFALIVLTVMRPRVLERQAQLERKVQGRQRAAEQAAGREPQTPLSTPSQTVIPLGPLFVLLGAAWIVSWIMLWRRRRGTPESPAPSSPAEKGCKP
ncbi:MAG: hypothetical protein KY475_08115 [Planctomycetes bacterium]|nr:hypothetical protein [Planctomycetota bacterium]